MEKLLDKLKEFGIRITIFFLVALSVAAFLICIFGGVLTAENPAPVKPKQTVGQQTVGQKNAKAKEQSAAQENEENIYLGIAYAKGLWVENRSDVYDYEDGLKNGDKEFLLQMLREGRAKFVENPAGVVCKGEYAQGKVIQITFLEGRYKNKRGYIFADFVQRIKEPK